MSDIGFRLPLITNLYSLLKVNIVIAAYRGFGFSEGFPTEQGIMLDSESIVNYVLIDLKNKINPKDVYIMGRSLGGAVGIYISSYLNPDIKGLIIENTFLSLDDLIDKMFPFLKYIKSFVLRNHWPSKNRIKNIKFPILFFMSEKDELIPISHMEELYSLAENALFKTKLVIPYGTHNDSWKKAGKKYFIKFAEFLKKCGSNIKFVENFSESNYDSINDDEMVRLCKNNVNNSACKDENDLLIDKKSF